MAGKAIMKPSPRSRARVETAAWTDGRGGGGRCPGRQHRSTRFSQSRAAWPYQPFHQPLNARPCLLPNTQKVSGCLDTDARLNRRTWEPKAFQTGPVARVQSVREGTGEFTVDSDILQPRSKGKVDEKLAGRTQGSADSRPDGPDSAESIKFYLYILLFFQMLGPPGTPRTLDSNLQ